MSYSPAWSDVFHVAGTYVGRILRGASPAEMPFQMSDRFELAINIRSAKALGLTLSPPLLAVADAVIE